MSALIVPNWIEMSQVLSNRAEAKHVSNENVSFLKGHFALPDSQFKTKLKATRDVDKNAEMVKGTLTQN